jgi:hypothetical protein
MTQTTFAALASRGGSHTRLVFDDGNLSSPALRGEVDAYIVSTEDGFSPLGRNTDFLSSDLGIPADEIRALAHWNHVDNREVSLVALPSRREGSALRGVILAPAENSRCYAKHSLGLDALPARAFYYNVTHEAIAHAASRWGARRIALSHLSASGRMHADIATCNAEALAHYCDAHEGSIESFLFLGCCIREEHLRGIARLNREGQTGRHREIRVETVTAEGHEVLNLEWR